MVGNCLKKRTAGIILAAGTSTRLGRPKQLLLIEEKPMLGRVMDAALDSKLDQSILVLGHRASMIQKKLSNRLAHPKLRIVINPTYQKGMAGSLQAGLNLVKDDFEAVMVILADHPYVDRHIINKLLDLYSDSEKMICVPTFKGIRGHPVILGRQFYPQIFSLTGDIGARKIIGNNPDQLLKVELENDRPFIDIDSDQDLARILSTTPIDKTKGD